MPKHASGFSAAARPATIHSADAPSGPRPPSSRCRSAATMFLFFCSNFSPFLSVVICAPRRAILTAATLSAWPINPHVTQVKLSCDLRFFVARMPQAGQMTEVPAANTERGAGSPCKASLYAKILSSLPSCDRFKIFRHPRRALPFCLFFVIIFFWLSRFSMTTIALALRWQQFCWRANVTNDQPAGNG